MQITYYRHKKGVLRMHSRDMEYIVGLLKNGKDAEAILSVRRKLNMALLARTKDLSGSGFWFDVQEEWRWNTVEAL